MVSSNPKFTVLLPTHNRSDVIKYAIESVLLQTEKSFELFIVGDGCTDNTRQVVKKYLRDQRVRWFDLPKAYGFGYANRNIALKQAKGKYVAYIAHDDFLTPDHLSLLGKKLDASPHTDIVYSRPLWISRDGYITPSSFNLSSAENFKYFMDIGNYIPACCFVHRRSCFNKAGLWPEDIERAGDWDLWKRIFSIRKNNWAFESMPTTLHFVANWKEERLWFSHDYQALLMKKYNHYPPELHIPIKESAIEQAVVWNKFIKKPKAWTQTLRDACITFLDNSNHHLVSKLYEAEEEIKKLQQSTSSVNILIHRLAKFKRVTPGAVRSHATKLMRIHKQ